MKRKVIVLFLAVLILSLVIIVTPIGASDCSVVRYTPPTDESGYTLVEIIRITCTDGQTHTYVGYGASVVPL